MVILFFDQNPTFYKKAFAKTNGHKCVFLSSIQKGPITDLKCEPYNMFCIHIFPCPSHFKFNHPAILYVFIVFVDGFIWCHSRNKTIFTHRNVLFYLGDNKVEKDDKKYI